MNSSRVFITGAVIVAGIASNSVLAEQFPRPINAATAPVQAWAQPDAHAFEAPVYGEGQYPAPRYPALPKTITLEHLMPVARALVRRPDIGYRYYPGYDVKPDERVLIVANRDYDPLVIDALRLAIQEVGAKADVLTGNDETPGKKDPKWKPDGSLEVDWFAFPGVAVNQPFGGIKPREQLALALAGNYDLVLSGTGGGWPNFPADKMRWVYLPWMWPDQFFENANNMPPELLKFIDTASWAQVKQAVKLHATDPEGTDLSWTSSPEQWNRTERKYGTLNMGHQLIAIEGAKATGVIAGTWNDTGPFPYLRLTLQDGRMVKMEGGGAYAEKWRAIKEKYKDLTWPGKPGPGLFTYLEEVAISSNPRNVVPLEAVDYARGHAQDRTRSGIIHFGIGAGSGEMLPQWVEKGGTPVTNFFRANPDVPGGHFHVHNYFITLEITDKDGKTSKVIDKGRLTVLDDPAVRREAAKYGDPDKLLREQWIPAIPGINVPGDYMHDYAQDPGVYLRRYIDTHWMPH